MSDNFSAVYIFIHFDDYKLQTVFHKYQDIKTWENRYKDIIDFFNQTNK